MWLGRKQHVQLAIWPIGTVMISSRGLTATIIFISTCILCVHAVDRARLSVDSTIASADRC